MPILVTRVLILVFIIGAVVVITEAFLRRFPRASWMEALGLGIAFSVIHWTTGFPTTREAFSGTPSAFVIILVFFCIVLGMIANYLFYLRGRISWISLLKPLCVSPIVMLPLVGTIETRAGIESIQIISLAFLSFQNGFFWRTVFEHAKKN